MKTVKQTFEEYYVPCRQPCGNRRGFKITYQYTGPWYSYCVEKKILRRYKFLLGILGICAALCFFGASLQESEINRAAAPTMCAMLSLAVLLFEWTGIIWFCAAGEKVTEYSFNEMHMIMKIAAPIHAALLLCTVVASVFMIFAESLGFRELTVPVLFFCSGMCSFSIFRIYGKLRYERVENEMFSSVSGKEGGDRI